MHGALRGTSNIPQAQDRRHVSNLVYSVTAQVHYLLVIGHNYCCTLFQHFWMQLAPPLIRVGQFSIHLYAGCCVNTTMIMLSNLNCSLICNTKAEKPELVLYQVILFGQVIYNAHLILVFISSLSHEVKDQSILLVSLIIANQVLIMDLIFRAAYEDRERQEQKEQRLLHRHHLRSSSKTFEGMEIELTPH